ncbi:MAG: YafY family transcriptional regulator [Bacteroidetes bacterium]|jgi:predicted DNA-binding transcriptional regulator YafY|nr:YafY family transcriptional regulator [Bacteroidota bacterium]MBP9794986.1 YafY family transcriptional regulator [Chitinophagales bacterium]
MNRIERLSAILIQLQSKRIVRGQEIAKRFGISLRTVYRDISSLDEAGVPIRSEAGVGYSLMEGYKLPPVMFTLEEAIAFLTAEKLVEKFTDSSTENNYKSAMYKIRSVLGDAEKRFLENIDDHIQVLKNPYLPEKSKGEDQLQIFLSSIAEKTVLNIVYFAAHDQKTSERNIEPIGIFHMANHWHVVAWCQLRNDYRDFRVDRISKVETTRKLYSKQHPTLKKYLQKKSKEKELFKVVMLVNKEILFHFGEQKYYNGFIAEREIDNKIEMTFLSSSLEGFARWFIMFGDNADIVEPTALKLIVKKLATFISRK